MTIQEWMRSRKLAREAMASHTPKSRSPAGDTAFLENVTGFRSVFQELRFPSGELVTFAQGFPGVEGARFIPLIISTRSAAIVGAPR